MRILRGFFRGRDHPKNSYDSPSYSYFFGRSNSGKRVNDRTAMQHTVCMPVCEFCQKRLPNCHYTFTNIPKTEKSECHGIRSIFCCMISQIRK